MCHQVRALDGSWLAASVRLLAGEFRRLAEQPRVAECDLAAVSGRLEEVQALVRDLPRSSLHGWVESMERELERLASRSRSTAL